MNSFESFYKIFVALAIRVALRIQFLSKPIKNNRVVFSSFRGKQYSCNPRAISEYLQRMAGEKIEIIWAFREPEKFKYLEKTGIRVVKEGSKEYREYALTARVMCINTYYKPAIPRRRGQFFLRTWHGGGAYKRVAGGQKLSLPNRLFIAMQQQGAHLYLSSSHAFTKMTLRESFGYKGEVLECGMPRNDRLVNGECVEARKSVYEYLHLDESVRIALYAPTYRDYAPEVNNTYMLDIERVEKALAKRFGGEWKVVFRGHHVNYRDRAELNVPNASQYPDMQDVLLASDVLITDYSSSIWDMSLMYRPAFLYATDLDSYLSERDFYTDIHTWPFPLSENNDELEKNILSFNEDSYQKAVARHHQELGSTETGHASEMAAKRIYDICMKGERQ